MMRRYHEEPQCPICGKVLYDYDIDEENERKQKWQKIKEIALSTRRTGRPRKQEAEDEENNYG